MNGTVVARWLAKPLGVKGLMFLGRYLFARWMLSTPRKRTNLPEVKIADRRAVDLQDGREACKVINASAVNL